MGNYWNFTGTSNLSKQLSRMFRGILLLLLTGTTIAISGCSPVQNSISMKQVFPDNYISNPDWPPVTVFPVKEALLDNPETEPYKADHAFLGRWYIHFGTMWIFIPLGGELDEYRADIPRTEIFRMAARSRLESQGIPVVYPVEADREQAKMKMLQENPLSISMTVRKLNIDTAGTLIPLIVVNTYKINSITANVTLDCQVWRQGGSGPFWQGSVEGQYTSDKNVRSADEVRKIVSQAAFAAVDKCVTNSGLLAARTELSKQMQAKLKDDGQQRHTQQMDEGRKQEALGENDKAIGIYEKAAVTASTPEQRDQAKLAVTNLLNQIFANMMDEGRKQEVQGENDKAIGIYEKAAVKALTQEQRDQAKLAVAKLHNQIFANMMDEGRKQADNGESVKALNQYSHALSKAVTPEQSEGVFKAMGELIRTSSSQIAIPEEARKFKVQAEGAVRDKDFADAVKLYGKALAIAPWWPEGYYNRAVVLGESKNYTGAISDMNRYLALVPDAPNARIVQDKVYDWERKLGK